MTVALDPKFLKVVALMRSTQHEGERAAASAKAEAMAAAAVLPIARPTSFRPAPHGTLAISFFAALDLMKEFAPHEISEAWRAACLDVLVASTVHLGEREGCRAMEAARARSIEVEMEAMARVRWH